MYIVEYNIAKLLQEGLLYLYLYFFLLMSFKPMFAPNMFIGAYSLVEFRGLVGCSSHVKCLAMNNVMF